MKIFNVLRKPKLAGGERVPDPFNDASMMAWQAIKRYPQVKFKHDLFAVGVIMAVIVQVPLLLIFAPGENTPEWMSWQNYLIATYITLPVLAVLTVLGHMFFNWDAIRGRAAAHECLTESITVERGSNNIVYLAERLHRVPATYRKDAAAAWDEMIYLYSRPEAFWTPEIKEAASERYKALCDFVWAAEEREEELAGIRRDETTAEILAKVDTEATDDLNVLTTAIHEMNREILS